MFTKRVDIRISIYQNIMNWIFTQAHGTWKKILRH